MTHFTALERMLQTERIRQRAARLGGFATPALNEVSLEDTYAPLLATNMKGTFLPTRPSKDGLARYGFSYVPVGTDDSLLRELHHVLKAQGWDNRCTSIQEALHRMHDYEPKTIVVGPTTLAEVLPGLSVEDAWKAQQANSEVGRQEDLTILMADIPGAFVAAAPALVGAYTRIGDHLGVLLKKVSSTLMVVG